MSKKIQGEGIMDFDSILKGGEFDELNLDRAFYSPEACGDFPLVGYAVDIIEGTSGTGKNTLNWKGLIVHTTMPTKCVDREGTLIDVKAGEDVLIIATHQILQAVGRLINPEVMYKVAIQPKEKIDLQGGKTMWTFRLAVSKETMKRTGGFLLQGASAQIASNNQPVQFLPVQN